jgi:hypothetical protein
MKNSPLFRAALHLDIVNVTAFVVRALLFGTQTNLEARSARADAVVAAAGLSLAAVAFRHDTRAPIGAGLILNTTGCAVTLILHPPQTPPSTKVLVDYLPADRWKRGEPGVPRRR